MSTVAILEVCLLVTALLWQALVPQRRLLVVLCGAALSAVILGASGGSVGGLLREVPWDVLLIVISLGLLSEHLASSKVFHVLAVRAVTLSGGSPVRLGTMTLVGMYAVSGLVNNLTALLLVLPVLLGLLKLVGVTRRYLRWTLGPLLVACNLGGAATPIGDFPAILLLGRGTMSFDAYLTRAFPQTLVALALMVGFVVWVVRPGRDLDESPLALRLAQRTTVELNRRLVLRRRRFFFGAGTLASMLLAWAFLPPSWGIGPELVAWVGTMAALASEPRFGEELVRRKVDAESALFLFALFVMVGAVREVGVLDAAAKLLLSAPLPPVGQLGLFLVLAAFSTGVTSAGPSMAALLDVAAALAKVWPAEVVYVALAMSVCAGSSLFLTAATAGPLAQSLVERAQLRDPEGRPIGFGFMDHLAPGLLGFVITLGVGLGFALWSLP